MNLFRAIRVVALALGCMVVSGGVHAACASPVAQAGQIMWASNISRVVYCDGNNWVQLGGSGGGSGASALSALTDVNTSGASTGSILSYNGTTWVVSSTVSATSALGDRISSGTLAMIANSNTSVVSLSTAGTTWGYLANASSYLPQLTSPHISATNISGSLIQVGGGNGASCDTARRGALRYSTTSSTVEYCNSTAWVSMGSSSTWSAPLKWLRSE